MTASFSSKTSALRDFPYFALMRATWRYMGEYKNSYVFGLILLSAAICVWLTEPYLIGLLFDVIQNGLTQDAAIHKALFIVLLIFLLEPIGLALHGPGRIIERQAGFFARQNFVQDMYGKLQKIPYAWHQDFHSGQLFDRIRKAESALDNFTGNQYRYLMLIFNFCVPTIALTLLFPWFGLSCIIFVVFAAFVILKFDARLMTLYEKTNGLTHHYAGVFSDYIANIRTIITLRLGASTKAELLHRYAAQKPVLWQQFRLGQIKWTFISLSSGFLTSALIAIGVLRFHHDVALKIGSLVMLVQYLGRFANVFYSIGEMYQEVVKAASDYRSVGIIDDALARQASEISDRKGNENAWQLLEICDLCFAYNGSDNKRHALHNISFRIKQGEKIALVGLSGAGKSTLMTLLRGLYSPDSGYMLLDGERRPIGDLSALTTLIPQDPEIFENTIRYNITFGVEHSDAEIEKTCRIAGFDHVLAQLPKGLETDIREKGVNLSGGQKQRLALARGVFAIQESSLVLLDEPTSSVDTATEIKIFDQLFAQFDNKAVIASVHRLHLLPRFDRVIVMEDGRIIEQGALNELLARDGALNNLWRVYQKEQAFTPS